MNADRDITRLLRNWLHQDRGEDADRIIDAVLDQIDWIEQRRPGRLARRFSFMNGNRLRFGIAAAAVVAVGFLGLRFLPANLGGPEPIPETAFVSERHHYMLLFPDDSWTMIERAGTWAPGTAFNVASPGLDVGYKAGEWPRPLARLSSQPLDVDPAHWLTRHDQHVAVAFPNCSLGASRTRTVGGEEARVHTYECEGLSDGAEAIIFHRDRAYVIWTFHEDDASHDPLPVLDELLSIFRFTD
jgi:hypothetical protein